MRQPMLAAKCTDEDLKRAPYPLLLSPKIDGIRATVRDGKLLSRSMKPIPNHFTQNQLGLRELEGLDGELVVGNPYDPNLMQQTSSGVMSHFGRPAVRFFVFDLWDIPTVPFAHRTELANATVGVTGMPILEYVQHTLIRSYEELTDRQNEYLEMGYEGVMLRAVNGHYKYGRSTLSSWGMVKVKIFTDDEAVITGFEPLYRNLNPVELDERGYSKRSHSIDGKFADSALGTLIGRCLRTNREVRAGSGFTASQRVELWENRDKLIGKVFTFKHFDQTGVKHKPRQGIFKSFRSPLDM